MCASSAEGCYVIAFVRHARYGDQRPPAPLVQAAEVALLQTVRHPTHPGSTVPRCVLSTPWLSNRWGFVCDRVGKQGSLAACGREAADICWPGADASQAGCALRLCWLRGRFCCGIGYTAENHASLNLPVQKQQHQRLRRQQQQLAGVGGAPADVLVK